MGECRLGIRGDNEGRIDDHERRIAAIETRAG
jgi:hypothetical protein